MEMSMNQLVDLTGLNQRTIKKRLEPLNPVREDGRSRFYDTREALKLLYPTVSTQMAQESLLFERAKREKAEIEVGRLHGQLISIEDVAKVVEKQYTYVRSQIRAMPSKLAKPLSMIDDPHAVHTRIAETVDECLAELTADKHYAEAELSLTRARSAPSEESSGSDEADPETESS